MSFLFHDNSLEPQFSHQLLANSYGLPVVFQVSLGLQLEYCESEAQRELITCPDQTANKWQSWDQSQGLLPQGLCTCWSLCWEYPPLTHKLSIQMTPSAEVLLDPPVP